MPRIIRFEKVKEHRESSKYLREMADKFDSGEVKSFNLAVRWSDGSMGYSFSKSEDVFDDYALACYAQFRAQTRMES